MANIWKRERSSSSSFKFLILISIFVFLYFLSIFSPSSSNPSSISALQTLTIASFSTSAAIRPFDCSACPQASPVFASVVEGVAHPFLYSLADLGALPDKPHKNIARMLKGKPFRRPDISVAVQEFLASVTAGAGIFVDVGANVGMATFAAAAMGFRVVSFEPVFENLQRICDGVFLNRAWDRVTVFPAAASDQIGNITFYKLVGRLDNSAVSASGARMAFKSNEEIAIQVPSVRLDDVIPDSERVLLVKIDVQGWEYNVLRGATKLLSRKKGQAPYLIYEEDERLLQASNSSAREIRNFLSGMGYQNCKMHGTDAHCTKD